jgi:hypothetical protein
MMNPDEAIPQSISLPGAGGGAPGGPGGPAGGGGSRDPDEILREAKALIAEAIAVEKDEEDLLQLEDIATKIQKYLATSQKLVDSVMGGGPGAKLIRKTAQAG